MSPIFLRHFQKTAAGLGGVLASMGRGFSKLPPSAQTGIGVIGSTALSEGEHRLLDNSGLTSQDPGTNSLQRIATHALNLTMLGLPYGNPRLRSDSFSYKNPTTGLPVPGSFNSAGALKSVSGKVIAAPILSSGINLATATGDIKGISGKAEEGISNILENVTGAKPGETPHEAAARRMVEAYLDPTQPVPTSGGATTAVNTQTVGALEKAIAAYSARHPERQAEIESKKPQILSGLSPIVEEDVANRDIGRSIGGLGTAVSNIEDASKNISAVSSTAADTAKAFDGLDARMSGFEKQLKPVSDLAKWVPQFAPKVVAGAAGAAALFGGYNLLRDYLNYQRVKKEREAKMQQPKLAAYVPGLWKGLSGLQRVGRIGTVAGIGAAESAFNYDPDHPANAVIGGLLGMYGSNKMFDRSALVRKLAPYGTAVGAMIPRSATALQAVTKSNNAEAASHQTTPASMAMGVGAGALTIAGLAALYQGTRAAKRVAEGQPLVDATTTNTNNILTGSGGPENPNFGGKMLVTLPTKNPGDRETTIELPLENMPLSSALINKIRRDTKRRLRSESDVRTLHMNDETPQRIERMMAVT